MPVRSAPPRTWRTVLFPPAAYPYFERPPEFALSPRVGRLNLLQAAWMADAAMLSYARSGEQWLGQAGVATVLRERGGFSEVEFLGDWTEGAKGEQGYFATRREFAVLAFRGTEADDWRDLAADLATWPVAERNGRVHRGFQAQLNGLWPRAAQLLARYRSHGGGEICCTGHSLGAAMATIAISRFEGGDASLYTFGSPRAGNGLFGATVAAAATAGHFRIVDRHDIVTRVPPRWLGYEHPPGTLYRIDDEGGMVDRTAEPAQSSDTDEFTRDLKCLAGVRLPIDLDAEPPVDLYHHGPACYATALWNACY